MIGGPALFLSFLLTSPPAGLDPAAWTTAGIGLWMAVWWMTEAVPIPATSLLPLVLFPLLGISDLGTTAAPYANPLIFLFMGGFILALAMERCDLHRRIALIVLGRVGTRPGAIMAGFMFACALLSMWVTNTATAMMMLPIGMSVVALAAEDMPEEDAADFGPALMLAIAYACSIGGLGTLVGTVPNALLAGFMEETYGVQIGFVQWMFVGVPLVVAGLPITYIVLSRVAFSFSHEAVPGLGLHIRERRIALGESSPAEKRVAAVFGVVVVLWLVRPLLSDLVPGLTDTGIALAGAIALFVIPSGRAGRATPWKDRFLMDWSTAKRLPWGILVLFGGGLSLAAAINETGLAAWIGGGISAIEAWPVLLIMAATAAVVIFLTELTSNTATTAAFLPVVASVAMGIGQDPLLLAVPATLAASAAFMLPVATPPNAIVYGSNLISIGRMARTGVILNGAFILIVSMMVYFLVQWVFGVQPGVLPAWVTTG